MLHAFPGHDTVVEEGGHIGHGAVLHGCIVASNALVGMNAVVNDNAVIGESAIVAAMAFVKAGMIVPPRTLVAGIPRESRARADRDGARVEDRRDRRATTSSRAAASRRCGDAAARSARTRIATPRPAGNAAAARPQGTHCEAR